MARVLLSEKYTDWRPQWRFLFRLYYEQDIVNNSYTFFEEVYLNTSSGVNGGDILDSPYGGAGTSHLKKTSDSNYMFTNTSVLRTYYGPGTTLIGTGTRVIKADDFGNLSINWYGYASGLSTGVFTYTLPTIPRGSVMGNIPAFAIEDSFTIPVTKYVGSYTDNLTISYGNTTIITIQGVSDGQTIQFTTEQINQLYELTSNVQAINGTATFNLTFKLDTLSGSTLIGSSSKNVQGLIVNANPVLNSYTYLDTNSKTFALTENNQRAIQNQSTLKVTGNYTLKKGATFKNYVVTIGNQVIESDTIIPDNVGTNLIVQVKDSRGNISDSINKAITIYAYSIPNITNIELTRPNKTNNQIFLIVNGTYSNILTNAIQPIQYQYRLTGSSTWSNVFNLNLTQTNGVISINNLLVSLDNSQSYEFQIIIGDKVVNLEPMIITVMQSIPELEILKGRVNAMIFPIGSIYTSVNNVNPSEFFGGTWVEFAKGQTLVGVDTSQSEFNTVKKSGGDKNLQEHFHAGIKWVDDKGISLNTGSSTNGYGLSYANNVAGQERNILTQNAGTGKGQNLQPYITCYMWERTA